MTISPLTRAKRVFKNMSRFRRVFDGDIPLYTSAIPIGPDESLIGVYENVHDHLQHCVAVTDGRILVEHNGEWDSVPYSDLIDVQIPSPAAALRGDLALILKCIDRVATVPIQGTDGHFFDLFEFSRFLDRVRADQAASNAQKDRHK